MRAKTLITVLSLVGCAFCAPTKGPTVTIANGAIVGTTTQLPHATQAVNKYLGIPFAASPPERFSPPTDPARFTEAYDATAFKPACIQQFNYPKSTRDFTINIFNNPPPPESEDCLYLNVFTPACKGPKRGRAVMFWIYGGNLQFGYGGLPTYDGSSFAANQDVVVVTINYRTNGEDLYPASSPIMG
jgi:carboxylesterase type B